MKKVVKIIILASLLGSQSASAGTQSGDGVGTASPSVNSAANDSKDKNSSGKGMSMMTAAMYAAMAAMEASQCPTNSSACALAALHAGMAALSMMQGKEHGGKAADSAVTAFDTNAMGSSGAAETLGGTQSGDAAIGTQTADMKKLESGIGGVQANFKDGTVKVNGKEYPASSFSSPAAMSAAGFSPDAISNAMSVVDKVNKKVEAKYGALTAANGYEEGGGGGGGGSSASSSGDDGPGSRAFGQAVKMDRDPAQLAGMTKDFNGEPIGVAADSIFEMMNRRYVHKDKQNAFINENDLLLQK